MKTVGERIRQARQALGMSGESLAHKVGYKHQSAISNLEGRNTGSGGHKIAAIANALGVPLDWLLNGPDDEPIPFKRPQEQVTGGLSIAEPQTVVYTIEKKPQPDPTALDPWTREAVEIMSRLREHEKAGALANLRTYVHNLGPPRDGQALSVAGK
jgi:transcriptional regulator with XRE-family HTH domain